MPTAQSTQQRLLVRFTSRAEAPRAKIGQSSATVSTHNTPNRQTPRLELERRIWQRPLQHERTVGASAWKKLV